MLKDTCRRSVVLLAEWVNKRLVLSAAFTSPPLSHSMDAVHLFADVVSILIMSNKGQLVQG